MLDFVFEGLCLFTLTDNVFLSIFCVDFISNKSQNMFSMKILKHLQRY